MTRWYFVRRAPGALYPRYFVLSDSGGTVIGTQLSCPDGIEVVEPVHVRFRKPADPREVMLRPARSFHPVTPPKAKRCPRCRLDKAATDFHGRADGKLSSWCRRCTADLNRERRKRHAEA